MKNKCKLLTFLLMPLMLLSCAGNATPYGEYSFIMGSTKGSHFGVYLDLTQEIAVPPETSATSEISTPSETSTTSRDDSHTYYKFTFKYENVTVDNTSVSISSNTPSVSKKIDTSTSEETPTSITQVINGGYYIRDNNTLAIDIYIWNSIVLPSEFLDDFLIITLNKNYESVNINIPVSIDDTVEIIIAKWEGREAENVHTVDIVLAKE